MHRHTDKKIAPKPKSFPLWLFVMLVVMTVTVGIWLAISLKGGSPPTVVIPKQNFGFNIS